MTLNFHSAKTFLQHNTFNIQKYTFEDLETGRYKNSPNAWNLTGKTVPWDPIVAKRREGKKIPFPQALCNQRLLHIGQYIQSNAWGLTSKTVLATEHYAVKKAREKKKPFPWKQRQNHSGCKPS